MESIKNADKAALEKQFILDNDTEYIKDIERCIASSYMLGTYHADEENPNRKIQATDEEIPAIPFKEAIDFLKTKVPLSKEDWNVLEPEMRFRAFTVAKLGEAKAVDMARQKLIKALEKGEGYAETWEQLKSAVNTDALGITPGYWENVFRTNTQSAYIAGKLEQYQRTDGIVAYQLFVIEDSRTSKVCRNLLTAAGRGLILAKDHQFWGTYGFPPYHFQCRSSVRAIYKSQLGKNGLKIDNVSMEKIGFEPGEGFGTKEEWWQITPSQVKQAVKYRLVDIFEKEESILNLRVWKGEEGRMAQFIREKYNRWVPSLEKLVNDSQSVFTTIEKLKSVENFKPLGEALEFLKKNYPEASFKNIVWGTSKIMSRSSIAVFYWRYPDTVFLNAESDAFRELKSFAVTLKSRNVISTSSPMHYIFHEAGHKWVHENLNLKFPEKLSDEDAKYFTDNISGNAGLNTSEAMAELFAMKLAGATIPDKVLGIIQSYSKAFKEFLCV